MKFFNLKEYWSSWSVWVMSAITVTPVLTDNVQSLSSLIPEHYRGWFVTGLGILGLIVRAIKQPNLTA